MVESESPTKKILDFRSMFRFLGKISVVPSDIIFAWNAGSLSLLRGFLACAHKKTVLVFFTGLIMHALGLVLIYHSGTLDKETLQSLLQQKWQRSVTFIDYFVACDVCYRNKNDFYSSVEFNDCLG